MQTLAATMRSPDNADVGFSNNTNVPGKRGSAVTEILTGTEPIPDLLDFKWIGPSNAHLVTVSMDKGKRDIC